MFFDNDVDYVDYDYVVYSSSRPTGATKATV